MFEDGALIGCLMLVGGAIVAMVLWGFLIPLPRPKRVKEKVIERGGLFRIDCGINIPTGRTVGALYRTPTRLQGKAYVYPVGNYCPHPTISDEEKVTKILFRSMRRGKTQPFPQRMGTPTHFSLNCNGSIRKDPSSIERGGEGTLPVTPEKQKGQRHALEGMGDKAKGDKRPLQHEARRVMQQRRRPRRVLMPREHPSDHLLGRGITQQKDIHRNKDV